MKCPECGFPYTYENDDTIYGPHEHGKVRCPSCGTISYINKGEKNMKGSTRWGLVTFALGITCGTLGHYLPVEAASFSVVIVSAFFGLFGKSAVEDKD